MAKNFKPKIVSANDVLVGDVVYLDAHGSWTRRLQEASVAYGEEAADALLSAGTQPEKVVGAYLVDVALAADGRRTPTHFREKFRDLGPSNRPDLGRQAKPGRHDRPSPRGGL